MDDKKKKDDQPEVDLTDDSHEGGLVEMEDADEPEEKVEMENPE